MAGADGDAVFDVIVIGAGPAGETLAGRTAKAGLRTALVERELVGGECSYWACIPSKTLLRPGAVLAAARKVKGASAAVKGSVDPPAAFARRDEAVSHFDDSGQVAWVDGEGVTLVRGTGRLTGPKQVGVEGADGVRQLRAERAVVLATGSHPVDPPIPGLDGVDAWDSRAATSSSSVPERLAVLGGGVVAVEMAQAWSWLGAHVTLLVRGDRLLEREEPFAGEALAASFAEGGIDIRFSADVVNVSRSASGVTIALGNGGTVEANELLVATGRKPSTRGIGLETVGVDPDGPLDVDDCLRVRAVDEGWLYAVGDVNGRAPLTHMGKYQARICAAGIAGKSVEAWSDHHAVPSVVFTDPQIASVGLRADAAAAAGMSVRAVEVPLSSTGGAYVNGDQEGTAQLVIDEAGSVVVGATFVGPEVAELLHSATIAIAGQVTIEQLWHAVPSFPTVSEVWLRLLEEYGL